MASKTIYLLFLCERVYFVHHHSQDISYKVIFSRLSSLFSGPSRTVWDLEARAIEKEVDPELYIAKKIQKSKYSHLPKAQQNVWELHDKALNQGLSRDAYIKKVEAAPQLYGHLNQTYLKKYEHLQEQKENLEKSSKAPRITPIYAEMHQMPFAKEEPNLSTASGSATISRSESLEVHPSSTKRLSEEKRPRFKFSRSPKRLSEEIESSQSIKDKTLISRPSSQDLGFNKECLIEEPPLSQHPSEAIPSLPKKASLKKKSQKSLLKPDNEGAERRVSTVGPLPLHTDNFTNQGLEYRTTDSSSSSKGKSSSLLSSLSRRRKKHTPYTSADTSQSTSKTSLATTVSQSLTENLPFRLRKRKLGTGSSSQFTSTSSLGLASKDPNFTDPFIQPRDKAGKAVGVHTEISRDSLANQKSLPKKGIMKTVEISTETSTLG
jgi:hypothetical protein